jgi:hypothetical protein
LDAKYAFEARQTSVNVEYVEQPYFAVADSLVTVSDSDIKKLYKEQKEQYKRKPSRSLVYVSVPVVPSETDYAAAEELMKSLESDFQTSEDIASLVSGSSSVSYEVYEYSETTIPEEYKNDIEIIYPYNDNTPVIVVPKELAAAGNLPISIKAVSVDADMNETAANVKWTTDASAVATVAATKAAKGQAAADVWGLATITVKKNAKANGLAVITATANDLKKATGTIEIDVRDYTPRLEVNSITLNTFKTEGESVKLYTAYDAILQDESNIEWVMEDIAKVWGEMLFNGATTFYETVKGHWDFHNAGSLCHGWAAIPIIYYHKYRCV